MTRSNWWPTCVGSSRKLRKRASAVSAELAEVDQLVFRQSEELAAVDSHLRALQGVLQEDMGYGRRGAEESTALKACTGVRDAIAEWLVVPPGWDRAVEAILGERVRGWFVDSPAAACEAIEFLKGKDLGRGTFIPQQPRWTTAGYGISPVVARDGGPARCGRTCGRFDPCTGRARSGP